MTLIKGPERSVSPPLKGLPDNCREGSFQIFC
jgi:hypothetical protein